MDEQTQMIHDEVEERKIRQDMEATQAKLASKLGALSDQVSDAVQTATDAVENTVEAVKETVEAVKETADGAVEAVKETAEGMSDRVQAVAEGVGETMHAVGETFNLSLQVQRHPWMALGAAVAVGFVAARLFSPIRPETARNPEPQPKPEPKREAKPAPLVAPVDEAEPTSDEPAPSAPRAAEEPHDEGPSWISQVGGRLRSAAVDSISTLLSQAAKNNLPAEIGERVAQEIQAIAHDV